MARLCALAAGLILLAAPARADEKSCALRRVTTVDMGIDAVGRMTVPMTVGGQTEAMLVDTGGLNTMLSESAVKALGLYKSRIANVRITIYGGTPVNYFTTAHDIAFGRLKSPSMDFLVLPEARAMAGIGGLLAPDILRAYDDDFDFANGRLALFSPDHCEGKVVYWTKDPVADIPIDIDDIGHIRVPVTIDGKVVRLIFDTGSVDTVLSFDQAQSVFGFDEKSPDLTVVAKDGDRVVYKYPFKTLSFGGGGEAGMVTVANPKIFLTSYDVSKISSSQSAILGLGILRQLHLYIAYKEHRLFVSAASAH
ncbi:MAG TPA: aspartyl protease family protein [Rhizomicrobium sp.]